VNTADGVVCADFQRSMISLTNFPLADVGAVAIILSWMLLFCEGQALHELRFGASPATRRPGVARARPRTETPLIGARKRSRARANAVGVPMPTCTVSGVG